ncbi:MAG: 5-oxoprolinase subunit PxpB [Chitinophagales bacterium]
MNHALSYSIFSLGDSAISIDFGNVIDEGINKKVLSLFQQLQKKPLPGMIEAVPAYSSLSIFYDVVVLKKNIPQNKTVSAWIKEEAEKFIQQHIEVDSTESKHIKIPVCYDEEFAVDLLQIAEEKKLNKEEIMRLHCSKFYRVFMLGFLPGFPYMGEVDEKIAMPRKPQPANVLAGSVAIAGRQTGIYSLASPGGWLVIGRTPIKLFDPGNEQPTLLSAGDVVEFYSISREEFLNFSV